jgi:predicted ATPase
VAAIEQAELALSSDPLQEWPHLLLMELLSAIGRRRAALDAYERYRHTLASDLGIAPAEQLRELAERLRAGAAPSAMVVQTGLRGAVLPTEPLIGRERELARIGELLADPGCRMLTVIGLGGVGKTRLALQASHDYAPAYAAGACFVALAGAANRADALSSLALALGLRLDGRADLLGQLLIYLREQQLLLTLDNLEHLPVASELASAILEAAPRVCILATSRQPLGLSAEWLLPLGGLGAPTDTGQHPAAGEQALRLFALRAARRQPGFTLDAASRPAIMQICRLLDGLPLAIELAAAWAHRLSVEQIAAALADGIDLLAADMPDLPPRHRSIREIIAQTWAQLSSEEQRALSRLSVFRGGFTHEVAATVLGAPTRLTPLAALIDGSLVRRRGDGRYELHELVRQFAEEQLRADPPAQAAAEAAHATAVSARLSAAVAQIGGARQAELVAAMSAEIDNLRVVWDRAVAGADWANLAELAEGLWRFTDVAGGFAEGHERISRARAALERAAPAHPLLTRLLCAEGALCERLGRYQEGHALLLRALRLHDRAGHPRELALILARLGQIADRQGRSQRARRLHRRSLACAQAAGDQRAQAQAYFNLASAAEGLRDYPAAEQYVRQSLRLWQSLGDMRGLAFARNLYGIVAEMQGRYDEARLCYQESLALLVGLGNSWERCLPLSNLGDVSATLGEVAAARQAYAECLELARSYWAVPIMLMQLIKLAQLLARNDDPSGAAELIAPALSHPATEETFRSQARTLMAELGTALSQAQISAAFAAGQGRSLGDSVDAAIRRALAP